MASGTEPHTTNQRMEVVAVIGALRVAPRSGARDQRFDLRRELLPPEWWDGWRRRGWRNTEGKPVANRDLWEPLLTLALDDGRPVRFSWVKGHSGDKMNDRVDLLAIEAADRQ